MHVNWLLITLHVSNELHLFNCSAHSTQLTVQDLWDNLAEVADFLNLDSWRQWMRREELLGYHNNNIMISDSVRESTCKSDYQRFVFAVCVNLLREISWLLASLGFSGACLMGVTDALLFTYNMATAS